MNRIDKILEKKNIPKDLTKLIFEFTHNKCYKCYHRQYYCQICESYGCQCINELKCNCCKKLMCQKCDIIKKICNNDSCDHIHDNPFLCSSCWNIDDTKRSGIKDYSFK